MSLPAWLKSRKVVVITQAEEDQLVVAAPVVPDPRAQRDVIIAEEMRGKLAERKRKMNRWEKMAPWRRVGTLAVGGAVLLTVCAAAGGIPWLVALLKYGYSVLYITIAIGGLFGCCLVMIVFGGAAFWVSRWLGFIKTPSAKPKKKEKREEEKKDDKKE